MSEPALPYRGLTWDHPRGFNALHAATAHTPLVHWDKQSLEGFESAPIAELCARYDLVVLDHPHLGEALAHDCLQALDTVFAPDELARIARDSIGLSYDSYRMAERQWALPLDAATQVMATRADRLDGPVPRTWREVLTLSQRSGAVALSWGGPHPFLSLLSIAAAIAPDTDLRPHGAWHDEATLADACDVLSELARLTPAHALAYNPIALLGHMSARDDIALCPLVYGYVNYATTAVAKPLTFRDAPEAEAGRPGSILGGTGIAISRRCIVGPELRAHLLWLLAADTQSRFIPQHEGQPSHRGSWADATVNAASGNFYANTARTLEAASIRPRHDGYIAFQAKASQFLRDGVAARASSHALARGLTQRFQASLTGAPKHTAT